MDCRTELYIDSLERIMMNQIGDTPGFMNDRLFDHVRADVGGFFYIPSNSDLDLPAVPLLGTNSNNVQKFCDDRSRFPGIDWNLLSRHFVQKSPNGRMFYNHKDYIFEMSTQQDDVKINPPSVRILTLLMNMFARWQDSWYFAKGQLEMGSLYDNIANDAEFGPEVADKVMAMSVMERKGWATRMQCRLYATDKYGYRGNRMVNGTLQPGADTYRIHACEYIVGALPDCDLAQGGYQMTYLREEEKQPAFFRGLSEASGVGHVLPDHQKLVNVGIGGLLAEIEDKKSKATEDKLPFYTSCALSLQGVQDHLERYAQLATEMAERCCIGENLWAENYRQIAARCLTLRTEKPPTMLEACQLIFTYHTCLHLNGEPVSLGRLDQYLGPFYDADIAAGRLDPETAQDIIDSLWIKLSEKILQNRIFAQDHQPYGNLAMGGSSGPYPQGASLGQWIMQVTVGGWVADEEEHPTPAYNMVTKLCIRASGRLPLTAPCLSLRVNAETPQEYLDEAAKAILSGGAHPFLIHDDKVAEGMKQSGDGIGDGDPKAPTEFTPVSEKAFWNSVVSVKSARNFASDGCYEPMFTGQSWFSLGGFSSLMPLECALNQGKTYASAGEAFLRGQVVSFRSKPVDEIKSFDEFLDLYMEHFQLLWAKAF